MRRLAFAALLVAAVAAPAAAAITGAVTVATGRARPAAGVPVALVRYAPWGREELARARADDRGAFAFRDVAREPGWTYVVEATYQGVRYASAPLRPGAVAVRVYEADPRVPLRIVRALVVIEPAPGVLRVSHVLRIANGTDRTLVAPRGGATLRFPLPAGATAVRFGPGFAAPAVDGAAVTDDGSIPPGEIDLAYAYGVPAAARADVRLVAPYPADRLEVLVASGVGVDAPGLRPEPPVANAAGTFARFGAAGLGPGAPVVVRLAGLPVERRWAMAAALALLALALAAGLIAPARRRPRDRSGREARATA